MTSHEFSEWVAYSQLEPFGEERADLRMGILASVLANVHRDPKQPAFEPKDFIPSFHSGQYPPVFERAPKPEQSPDEMLRVVEMLNAAFGGADQRLGKATD